MNNIRSEFDSFYRDKFGPATFLRFLSLKPYLTIEAITQDKKGA